jgi:hypothetical protein
MLGFNVFVIFLLFLFIKTGDTIWRVEGPELPKARASRWSAPTALRSKSPLLELTLPSFAPSYTRQTRCSAEVLRDASCSECRVVFWHSTCNVYSKS